MNEIINGDCLIEMAKMAENSIDFVVCDPPYMIGFMNKAFDKFEDNPAANPALWKEALRICKPGSMLAAFGGDRTHHHLMLALEEAGWEIRTCIYWCFGSGFPKSHNFGRKLGPEWHGYGTALKPAVEICVLAMKPLDGTFKQNAEKWGVGGINIDESRIGIEQEERKVIDSRSGSHNGVDNICYAKGVGKRECGEKFKSHSQGRWPANLILSEEAAELLDQQAGVSKSSKSDYNWENGAHGSVSVRKQNIKSGIHFGDSGGASRFFYCAKASSAERNRGLDKPCSHPTVKPLSLMKYLLKLLAPPGDPIVLDPFCGSGSTLVAAKELGIRAIGIEKSEEYCEIARARVAFEEKERFMQYEFAL